MNIVKLYIALTISYLEGVFNIVKTWSIYKNLDEEHRKGFSIALKKGLIISLTMQVFMIGYVFFISDIPKITHMSSATITAFSICILLVTCWSAFSIELVDYMRKKEKMAARK